MAKIPHSNKSRALAELRTLGEEYLLKTGDSALSTERSALSLSPDEILRLVHELEVHQVELEIQQEELGRSRLELEDSLSLYTDLYDFAPTGYLTLARDSKIHQANLTATKLLGVDRPRLLGLHFKQFIVPEDYRVVDALLETVFTKRVHGSCEVRLPASAFKPSGVHSQHTIRTLHLDAAVSDATHACMVTLSDITDQKVAEEGLRKSERNFRSIVEQITEVVYVANSKGILTFVSPLMESVFGYNADEVIGHSFTDYMVEEEIPEALQVFNNTLLHQEKNLVYEFKFKKKNGSVFYGEVHFQYYEDQALSGMIGLIRDMSERKRQEGIRQEYDQ